MKERIGDTFMANIKAFRGYRYNTDKIDNLGSVISPPYYNMTKEDKDALYDKSEYNSVRLFSGKKLESDTRQENTFTRAKNYLDKWIEDGILVRDEEPVIYMYEQTIEMYDTHYSNTSFVALVELEEIGKGAIMPCEKPHEVSMLDRYELLKSTNADMSMISCLYVEKKSLILNFHLTIMYSKKFGKFHISRQSTLLLNILRICRCTSLTVRQDTKLVCSTEII